MKDLKHIKSVNEAQENLNISDGMNSVLTELYNELSELNDTIKNIGSDNHEYYLGRIKGIESSIQIIEKHYS